MIKLSIEEKAKAYDEALKKAKSKIKDDKDHVLYEDDVIEIFPELSESKNEKIRKDIIDYLALFKSQIGEEYDSWIAWLKKQGEHANFRNKIQIGDKVTRNEDGILVNLSQLNRVAKKDEKQGEKNINNSIWHKVEPKEYVLEKTLIYKKNGEIDIVEDTILSAVDAEYALPISYLGKPESIEKQGEQKDILEDATLDNNEDGLIAATIKAKCEQKPAEWSEEDENKRKLCFQYLTSQKNYQSSVGIDYINGCLDWLDSLPNRVQPKQEWSEEDEDNIFNIVGALDVLLQREIEKQHNGDRNASPKYYSDLQDWLKSLRPDSHWKPSQEQMDALWKLMQYAPNLSVYTDIKESVESLYNDLKKLKN